MITRAYRKLVVRYHPDKAAAHFTAAAKARQDAATKLLASRGAASAVELARAEADAKEALKQATEAKAQAEPLFLAIQRAYDVLSDEKRRRGFDLFQYLDDFSTRVAAWDTLYATAHELCALMSPSPCEAGSHVLNHCGAQRLVGIVGAGPIAGHCGGATRPATGPGGGAASGDRSPHAVPRPRPRQRRARSVDCVQNSYPLGILTLARTRPPRPRARLDPALAPP
jgi:hypothetical protein